MSRKPLLPFIILAHFFVLSSFCKAQFNDRELYYRQSTRVKPEGYFTKPLELIDVPTASILRGGDFRAGLRIYEQGGLLASLSAGISNRVMFGVSFGGLHIIGAEQQIQWNSTPGVHFVYRVTEESMKLPAMVLGFDSQGFGPYWEKVDPQNPETKQLYNDRYSFKSRGFYFTVSKGYSGFITSGLHAGISYSLEAEEGKKAKPTVYIASDTHLARDLAFLFEYDFAMHDEEYYEKGLLNIGMRWAFGMNMFFEFDIENLMGKDADGNSDVRRILKLSYYGTIIR